MLRNAAINTVEETEQLYNDTLAQTKILQPHHPDLNVCKPIFVHAPLETPLWKYLVSLREWVHI